MCQFKSAIVLKNRIVCPLDLDSHTDILESINMKDDNEFPNFVRIEMIPKDGDIFNHNLNNWVLKVDQDFIPEWFDEDKTEKQMREIYMPEVFEKRFIIDREVDEITEGRWFMKNGILNKLAGSATIQRVCDSATIQRVCDSATVQDVYDSAIIQFVFDSATIQRVFDSATIQNVYGSAIIQRVCDSATIQDVFDSATIQNVYGSATIQNVYGSATVQRVCDSATVQELKGRAIYRKIQYWGKSKLYVPKDAYEIIEV